MVPLPDFVAKAYLVRVETNNRLHWRYDLYLGASLVRTLDDGRCGIDDNWVRSDLAALEDVEPERLCGFCFPNVSVQVGVAEGTGEALM